VKVIVIVEDDTDGHLLKKIAECFGFNGSFKWRNAGGVGEIKRRWDILVKMAKEQADKKKGCVGVVVDELGAEKIVESLKHYCKDAHVPLIIAVKEIESWLLTDPGFCKWLNIKPKSNTETISDPSRIVENALQRKKKQDWNRATKKQVAQRHLTAPDPNRNASLAGAKKQLLKHH